MTRWRTVLRGVSFYWRTHVGVLLGCTVSGAVLVGALLVGDSVNFSLRRFALLRLGGAHFALNARGRFFSTELADAVAREVSANVAPALLLRGMAVRPGRSEDDSVQVNHAQVMGVDARFWKFALSGEFALSGDEVAIGRKLASRLGVQAGDEIAIRVGKPSLMPRDAPLSSRKDRLSRRGALRVKRILEDDELGRFSLDANQIAPHNAFVSIEWLQEKVDLGGRANILLVGQSSGEPVTADRLREALRKRWRMEHAGIRLTRFVDLGLMQLQSDRVFLDPVTTRAAMLSAGPAGGSPPVEAAGVLTYLVNTIEAVGGDGARRVPYSFVTAITPSANRRLGPVPADMGDQQILVNRWLADRLGVESGAELRVTYYELTPSNQFVERARSFRVHGVLPMEDLAAEKALMPSFPGLTDVDSCREWDIGMPMDDALLRDRSNEEYWAKHRETPKAFVTLKAGQEMWANRFGNLSAVRYAAGPGLEEAVRKQVSEALDPAHLGLFFLPAREQAFEAVSQAMNFGELFLSMSFFLIAAALMLTGLLFVFGVQRRAEEMGILLAVGFRPVQVRRLLLAEGAAVAALGSLLGAVLGAHYTRALIWGLSTHWQGAVASAAIRYHAETATLFEGAVGNLVCAVGALWLAARRQARRPAHELLAADFTQEMRVRVSSPRGARAGVLVSSAALGCALAVVAHTVFTGAEQPVMPFFAAGTLLLAAGMGFVRSGFIVLGTRGSPKLSLARIGLRNVARRRGRSLMTAGLLACGCFLVFAVSSMKEDMGLHSDRRWAGTGGFPLFAESTLAVPEDLNRAQGRARFQIKKGDLPEGTAFVSLKVHDGDDASCFNLNRAQAPRLLGVDPADMSARKAFLTKGGQDDPWALLNAPHPDPDTVPGLVGDSDTAMWGLEKKVGPVAGDVVAYRDERGDTFKVKLVGKLPMRLSVFQGTILISARDFTARFPSEEGYRMFLIDAPADRADALRGMLSRKLDGVGLDVSASAERLAEFYGVQSTYLGMFLVLGGLGLVLGSVGMGIVVLRNVLERRGELGLLRAVGFSRADVHRLLMWEHGLLLAAGLVCGTVSAIVAVLPSLASPSVRVPYGFLGAILVGVVVSGGLWAYGATVFATRGSLVTALRNE